MGMSGMIRSQNKINNHSWYPYHYYSVILRDIAEKENLFTDFARQRYTAYYRIYL